MEAAELTFDKLMAAPSGRPGLFDVMRDVAIELGSRNLGEYVARQRQLWFRPPEEWELERVNAQDVVQLKDRAGNVIAFALEREGTTVFNLPPGEIKIQGGLVMPARRNVHVRGGNFQVEDDGKGPTVAILFPRVGD